MLLRYPRLLGVFALASALIFAAACDDNGENGDGVLPGNGDTTTETPTTTPTETETPEDGDETATPTETAAGGAAGGGGAVEVTETDFAIELGQDTIPAGETTFNVMNEGATPHNFIVIQTDMAPDALPVEGAQVALDQLEVSGQTDDIPAGESTELQTELQSGAYVTICNIPGHYELGMRAGLTVE